MINYREADCCSICAYCENKKIEVIEDQGKRYLIGFVLQCKKSEKDVLVNMICDEFKKK